MNKEIFNFFTEDHERIEAILDEATKDMDNIDFDLYHEFRVGLLTHIKMEEKILFPAAQKANGGEPLPLANQLRLDHGAITSLMVVRPTPEVIIVLKHVLEIHDELEERPGGMYDLCEELTKDETDEIMEELRNTTDTPVHPFNEKPYTYEVAKRSLARAGFDFDEIVKNYEENLTK